MPGTLFTQRLYLAALWSSLATWLVNACWLVLQLGRSYVKAFFHCQQQKLDAGAGWTRLSGSQLFHALQWLHSSKPSKLNVSLTELLTPGMLNYSVKQTSRRLELLRG